MSSQKAKRTGRIKHGEALVHYLKLGADRSLKRLWTRYSETMAAPPALVTIESWSNRFGWVAQAKKHDERVSARLEEKAEDTAVEQTWDKITTLTSLAEKALDKAIAGLDSGTIKTDDAYQIQALLNSAVTALKHIELVSGRATSRLGSETIKDFAPSWMAEALAAAAPAPVLEHEDLTGDETIN